MSRNCSSARPVFEKYDKKTDKLTRQQKGQEAEPGKGKWSFPPLIIQ
jgi:hypothetical protein